MKVIYIELFKCIFFWIQSLNKRRIKFVLTALLCNLLKEYLKVSTASDSSLVTSTSNRFKIAQASCAVGADSDTSQGIQLTNGLQAFYKHIPMSFIKITYLFGCARSCSMWDLQLQHKLSIAVCGIQFPDQGSPSTALQPTDHQGNPHYVLKGWFPKLNVYKKLLQIITDIRY